MVFIILFTELGIRMFKGYWFIGINPASSTHTKLIETVDDLYAADG